MCQRMALTGRHLFVVRAAVRTSPWCLGMTRLFSSVPAVAGSFGSSMTFGRMLGWLLFRLIEDATMVSL